jgi:putative SOS response-associated peptidase YedK
MCGRYSLTPINISGLEERFSFRGVDLVYQPRFNIAPTQNVLTVVHHGLENRPQLMKWGLIPFWAKDPSIGNRMINARAESVVEKPSFRQAFQKRRCLILADGFYEWKKEGKNKVPVRVILKSGEPFGFAGLWEKWRSPEGAFIHSCTIITTMPNSMIEPIHNRMPVILTRGAEVPWLDPTNTDISKLRKLLIPYAANMMETYKVSTLVNSPKNESPDVINRLP